MQSEEDYRHSEYPDTTRKIVGPIGRTNTKHIQIRRRSPETERETVLGTWLPAYQACKAIDTSTKKSVDRVELRTNKRSGNFNQTEPSKIVNYVNLRKKLALHA